MKKLISKLVVVCMLVGCLSAIPVQASGESLGGVEVSNETSSEVTTYSTLRGIYLWYGTSFINQQGTGVITAGGTTVARSNVASVSVTVTVQYYQSGTWKTYYSWSASASNDDYVSTARTISVPRGRYYCARTYHVAGGEALGSVSDGIWIG